MKSNKVLSIVGGVLFLIRARQEAQQAQFQKVLVLKSKAQEKSKVQDRIKH